MIGIDDREGGPLDLPLLLRATRASRSGAPARLTDRVVLGTPSQLQLTPERAAGDAELRAFIEEEADRWHYHLVTLSCTFVHDDDAPLSSAWIRVSLSATARVGGAGPIAQSMEPVRLADVRTLSYTARIAFPCVLAPEFEVTKPVDRTDVFLEALFEGTGRPTWKLQRTPSAQLRGLVRLRFIARIPAGSRARGELGFGAAVRHERLGLGALAYEVALEELPEGPLVTFDT